MKKIAVITSTRAEFGLLFPVVQELRAYENEVFKVELIVTGTHLCEEYGNTIDEIRALDCRIDKNVSIPVRTESATDISNNQAQTLTIFTSIFIEEQYDGVMILGDRYEMLAIAIAAGNTMTPIIHLCGGDTTEGACDEWIRHSISKISQIHFPTNQESYNRLIQLGEQPNRVFSYGSTSVDNILNHANLSKNDVLNSIGLHNCRFAIGTYHPETIENESVELSFKEIIDALSCFPQIEFIFTKANADKGGEMINSMLIEAEKKLTNLHVYSSLGINRYLSLMKYSEFVIGNSSSGIVEAPILKVPTVNIGERQTGRIQARSIVNCSANRFEIVEAINKVLDSKFRDICGNYKSPYGDGYAARRIAKKIFEIVTLRPIEIKKSFYDIRR